MRVNVIPAHNYEGSPIELYFGEAKRNLEMSKAISGKLTTDSFPANAVATDISNEVNYDLTIYLHGDKEKSFLAFNPAAKDYAEYIYQWLDQVVPMNGMVMTEQMAELATNVPTAMVVIQHEQPLDTVASALAYSLSILSNKRRSSQ